MQEDNAVSMSELGFDYDLHDIATVKSSQLISDENTRFILINKLAKVCNYYFVFVMQNFVIVLHWTRVFLFA